MRLLCMFYGQRDSVVALPIGVRAQELCESRGVRLSSSSSLDV